VLLATALLLAALLAAPAPADAKGNKTHALVVKEAHNPVLGALKKQLDRRLRIHHQPPISNKRRRHDLLVVDGDHLSAGKMARRKELRNFSNQGRWVLALDLESNHHSRAIAKRTGFEALADGEHTSRAFLFRHAIINGVPTEVMLDSERLRPTGTKGSGKGKRRKSTRREVRRIAKMVAERIRADDEELAQIAGVADQPAASAAPPEAIKAAYVMDAVKLSHHPPDGHYSSLDHGYQVTSGVMNHTFTVYLDNSTQNPQGNHQVVTYDLSGTFSPAQNRASFWHMDQTYNFGAGINRVVDRGWWTGSIGSGVKPADAATSGKLSPQATKPETENGQTTVSSEDSFSVGYSTESGVTANYSVSHGKSTEVKDWGVVNGTSGNTAGWQYYQQSPCHPAAFNNTSSPPDGQRSCFDYGLGKPGMPNEPTQLSLGAMNVEASARWNTKGMLQPGQTELSFLVDTPVTLYEHTCTNTLLTFCIQYEMDSNVLQPPPVTYKFDTADALPIPVKSVQLDAAKVTTKNQDVHGTVTLERKAPVDTSMVVTSNKQNAYLGTPISDQISRAEVDISKGQTQGTFTVKTNFNGLDAGDAVTAYITPFYAKTFTPQRLIIERPSS